MRIAVTTPTGHIGKVVTSHLLDLDAGAQVTLLVRNPEKVKEFADRGATVFRGSLDDRDFVNRATQGVDALFWLTPPDFLSNDLRGFFNRMGQAGAAAIRANRIPRVVHLSSTGAHLASDAGPVAGHHDVERRLDEVVAHITHLRPSFFFENYLRQLEAINKHDRIFMTMSGSTRIAMVATRDIAQVAALRLLDHTWTGRTVQGLHGPTDLSFDEAAAAIGRGLDRPVVHVRVPEEQARRAMSAAGLSEQVTEMVLELYQAIESGLLRPAEPRTAETTTPTTLEQFARDVLRPLVGRPVPA
jgi:uncharacterized protein YbjT (DUF2867 family)